MNTSKKVGHILFLTYDGLTDPLGQSQILPYLNGLAEKGWRFWVLSFEKNRDFKETPLHENINWKPLRYHKSPPVLSTLYDIFRLRKKAQKIVQNNNIKLVHCRSYITSLIGLELKRRYGVKFIFDMRGFWADERVEGGLWNLRNPIFKLIFKFFKKKENEFIRESDCIISLTEVGKKELLVNSKFEIQNSGYGDKITVIPTCVDTLLFDPSKILVQDKIKLRESLGIKKEDYVLMYVGSLGTWYLLEEMIAFFNQLKVVKSDSRFILLTNTKDLKLKDERIIVTHTERDEVPLYLAICDATICFIRPTFSKKASSATKIGESFAMGKPVIVNSGWGDVDRIFKDPGIGWIIKGFESSAVKSDIEKILKTHWDQYYIRDKEIQKFALSTGVNTYHSLYKSLMDESMQEDPQDLKLVEVEK